MRGFIGWTRKSSDWDFISHNDVALPDIDHEQIQVTIQWTQVFPWMLRFQCWGLLFITPARMTSNHTPAWALVWTGLRSLTVWVKNQWTNTHHDECRTDKCTDFFLALTKRENLIKVTKWQQRGDGGLQKCIHNMVIPRRFKRLWSVRSGGRRLLSLNVSLLSQGELGTGCAYNNTWPDPNSLALVTLPFFSQDSTLMPVFQLLLDC